MKKILVIALALVMVLGVFALTACAKEETYEGEYKYANPWDDTKTYGVKVKVVVKGDVILSVEITSTDTETYTNLSSNWTAKENWTSNSAAFLGSFTGTKVADINGIKVVCKENGEPDTVTGKDNTTTAGGATISEIPADLEVPVGTGTAAAPKLNGATQSAGRVILAVQNALSKIAK